MLKVALVAMVTFVSLAVPAGSEGQEVSIAAAILPSSRAVQVGQTATAFATILLGGPGTATACAISPTNAPPGTTFSYQPTTFQNVPFDIPNTPVDILGVPGSGLPGQSFLISITPTQPFAATELHFAFDCTNTEPAPNIPGVNTLLLTSSTAPTPDIVALAEATFGILVIPDTSRASAFAVASVNVGAPGLITATVDTGGVSLPLALSLCQTNPVTGACVNPATLSSSVTVQMDPNESLTFAIVAKASGQVGFEPAVNRIYVRFKTQAGGTVGSTSVAVFTGP